MPGLRIAPLNSVPLLIPCCRCNKEDRPWDRIAGKAYCPGCQESMILGESEPLVEKSENNVCAVCGQEGTIGYLSFPLGSSTPIAMDLCPEHFRALVGRSLPTPAFRRLAQSLGRLGVEVDDVFLLHRAFYDRYGRALKPASDAA